MDIAGVTSPMDSLDSRPVFGRLFEERYQSCRVAAVNEEAAASLSGKDTVGMMVRDPDGVPIEIVDVVRPASGGKTNDRQRPTIYLKDSNLEKHRRIAGARFRAPLATTPRDVELNVIVVSPGYLQALGLSLTDGHWFSDRQAADDCHPSGVINQEAADIYFEGKPLGAALIDSSSVRIEISGVVKSRSLGTFEQHAEPAIYLPMLQEHPYRMTLVIRASRWDRQIVTELRQKIGSLPGNDAASPEITTMDTRLAETGQAPLRIATLIFGSSAVISFALSILGLFSVHSDTERQRRRELALRMALGAQPRHIFSRTIKQIGQLAFAGVLTGTLVSIAGLRIFANDLSLISSPPIQVWFLAPILSILTLIITAAIVLQRALRIELQTVMREDE
jgi:hypothetical protein